MENLPTDYDSGTDFRLTKTQKVNMLTTQLQIGHVKNVL